MFYNCKILKMTTIKNILPENLIYDILTYKSDDFNDIMTISSLSKTFYNLNKKRKIEILFYKNVYDFIAKYKMFQWYHGVYEDTSFKHWFNVTHIKHMTSGFAVVNNKDLCKIKNNLKKYKFKKYRKIKKMKFYKILPGVWPTVTSSLAKDQTAIRFVIF